MKNPLARGSYRKMALAGLMTASMSIGLWAGQAPTAQALSWLDILRGGVQVFQGVQLSNMSDEDEMKLGAQINQQLLEREFKLYRDDPALVDYVRQVGARVARESDRDKIDYTVQVVEDDAINAFATAGGYLYVTTGLLKTAENEAELAGVLGHEVGHVEGRHLINAMSREAWRRGLLTAAGVDRNTAVQIGVELAIRRPGSRNNEYDADLRGLRIMREAGYAEAGMVSFMQKLQANSQGAPPTFLSTHPATGDRVKFLRENQSDTPGDREDGLNSDDYRRKTQALRRDDRAQRAQPSNPSRRSLQTPRAQPPASPANPRRIQIRIGR